MSVLSSIESILMLWLVHETWFGCYGCATIKTWLYQIVHNCQQAASLVVKLLVGKPRVLGSNPCLAPKSSILIGYFSSYMCSHCGRFQCYSRGHIHVTHMFSVIHVNMDIFTWPTCPGRESSLSAAGGSLSVLFTWPTCPGKESS